MLVKEWENGDSYMRLQIYMHFSVEEFVPKVLYQKVLKQEFHLSSNSDSRNF